MRPLKEPQGEGVAYAGDGTVFLASEGGGKAAPVRSCGSHARYRETDLTRVLVMVLALMTTACGRIVKDVKVAPDPAASVDELWQSPADPSGAICFTEPAAMSVSDTQTTFTFVARDTTGWSPGLDVRDDAGVEWSVKLGPESQSEVVASRVLWAIGFHQPPTYYLELVDDWRGRRGAAAGRFRPSGPGKVSGDWSWCENPFVGSAVRRVGGGQPDSQQLGLEDVEQQDLSTSR